jgi:phospholipid/cholesterol/gamma-HCH transport system ATP-binding protein
MLPSQSTSDAVRLSHVGFIRDEKIIFQDLNLTIPRGKIVAIMGPSGTGKTTALKLIGGQLTATQGQVWVEGCDMSLLSNKQLFQLRRRMGVLFQNSALFTSLTVFDNVAFPLREHWALPSDILYDLVLMKLEAVGLRGAAHLMPAQLSGGMARRVALARAIAMDPHLMMYDEPFTGLDPITLGVIVTLIRELNTAFNMTSIIVSHDVHETASIADYIYLIANGNVLAEGTPEALLSDETPAVKQFMTGQHDGVVPFHYPATKTYEEELLRVR